MAVNSQLQKLGQVDIQFEQTWDQVKANRLVEELNRTETAVNALITAVAALQASSGGGPGTVAKHELASSDGIGASHTVNGLTVGDVLIAITGSNVAFAKLKFQNIQQTDPDSFDAPENGDVITFTDGFWTAGPNTGGINLTDPGTNALLMWDEGASAYAWALPGTGINLTSGMIAVDDHELIHGHLLGLLADDHPQYALLAAPNTWTQTQTFQATVEAQAGLDLFGDLVQSAESPNWYFTGTDAEVDEGAWHLYAAPGQLIWATTNDDGSDGENWLSVTRIGSIADQINLSSNSFTWNGGQVLTPETVVGGNNVWFTTNDAGQLVINAGVGPGTPGTGTVTSVGFADTSTAPIYAVSGQPINAAGTIDIQLNLQAANTLFAGPVSGGAAQPAFRTIVAADLASITTLVLEGLELTTVEPAFTMIDTSSAVDEGGWQTHAEPGMLIFSTLDDSGSWGENWLTVVRDAELVESIDFSGANLTFNGADVLVDGSFIAGANVSFSVVAGVTTISATSAVASKISKGASWVNNGGAIVAAGINVVYVNCPASGTITGVKILTAGGPGNCVVDIWKAAYAGFPPVVGNSIVAAAKPTIAAGIKYSDTTLTGWTTAISAGDVLAFHLDSSATLTSITITLDIQP